MRAILTSSLLALCLLSLYLQGCKQNNEESTSRETSSSGDSPPDFLLSNREPAGTPPPKIVRIPRPERASRFPQARVSSDPAPRRQEHHSSRTHFNVQLSDSQPISDENEHTLYATPKGKKRFTQLPFWQRDQLREIFAERKAIYEHPDARDGAPAVQTPAKRRERQLAWSTRNLATIRTLNARERRILNTPLPDPPSEEETLEFIDRLSKNAPLSERDLAPVTYLLLSEEPGSPLGHLHNPGLTPLLQDAHQILCGTFPNSRTDLKSLAN